MSDVAAPAAPVAAPATTAPTQSKPAPAAVKPTGGPRSTDGRFSPKDGAVGVVKEGGETPEAAPTTPAEKQRLKLALKFYGKEENWEGTEDDVKRELQLGRAERAKREKLEAQLKERAEFERLAKENPFEFLKRQGHDPDALMKERLRSLVDFETMSPEQQEAHQAKRKLAEVQAKLKEREEKEAAIRQEMKMTAIKQKRIAVYGEAIKAAGVDVSNKEEAYAMVTAMAQTERDACFDEEGRRIMEFTPQELIQETLRRQNQQFERSIAKMDAKTLMKRLGPERIKGILEASIAEFESSQTSPVPVTPRATRVATDHHPDNGSRFKSEADIDRWMRENAKKR